jgi:hypothetical protein
MKLTGLIFGILTFCHVATFAQFGTSRPLGDKVYVGGGGGFGAGTSAFGYRYTYYSIFPIVGYRITPQFSAGTGVNYTHYGFPDVGVRYNQFGVSPFLRYNFNQLFFQTEYDIISSPSFDNTARRTYNRLLFGLGYSQPFGGRGRGAVNAMALYDVLYKQPSVFNSPWVFRVFVSF